MSLKNSDPHDLVSISKKQRLFKVVFIRVCLVVFTMLLFNDRRPPLSLLETRTQLCTTVYPELPRAYCSFISKVWSF